MDFLNIPAGRELDFLRRIDMLETESDGANKRAESGRVIRILEAIGVGVARVATGLEGGVGRGDWIVTEAVEVGIIPVSATGEGAKVEVVENISVEERVLSQLVRSSACIDRISIPPTPAGPPIPRSPSSQYPSNDGH